MQRVGRLFNVRPGEERLLLALLALLADEDLQVRRAALEAAGTIRNAVVWPTVVKALAARGTAAEAASALASGGAACLPEVKAALDQPDLPLDVRLRLIRVLGRIGGKASVALLIDHLESPSATMRHQALLALQRCGFRLTDEASFDLRASLRRELSPPPRPSARWWIWKRRQPMALGHPLLLSPRPCTRPSRAAVSGSCSGCHSDLTRVQDNLALASSEKRAYAVEALDTLLPPDLRAWVIPLMEELTPAQRLERLGASFSQPRLGRSGRLQQLWREADASDRWQRACLWYALHSAPLEPSGPVAGTEGKAMLELVEKVMILRTVGIFAGTPDSVLAEVAVLLDEMELPVGQLLFAKGDYGNCLYIIVRGRVRVHDGERLLNYLGDREIVGEMAVLDAVPRLASVTAEAETHLLRLDQEALYELMSDRVEVARGIIRVLSGRLRSRVRDLTEARDQLQAATTTGFLNA